LVGNSPTNNNQIIHIKLVGVWRNYAYINIKTAGKLNIQKKKPNKT